MSNPDPVPRHSIIELAMARASKQKPESDLPSAETEMVERSAGRRTYDEALSGRLNQMRSDLVEDSLPPPVASQNAEPDPAISLHAESNRSHRIASHLIAAAVGAALMWYAMGETVRAPESALPVTAVPGVAMVPLNPGSAPVIPPAEMSAEARVRNMLENWRQSWSNRAADTYLGFYSAQFVPADGTSRSAWAEGRRSNFLSKSQISVRLHDVTVVPIDAHHVKVTLLQDYASGGYTETRQPKTFLLARERNDWRIVDEWHGDRSPLPAI